VRWIDKVLELALERLPEPLADEEASKAEAVVAAPTADAPADPVVKH
jgi:ATP-dependent Lon protease